jgi:spore germination protein (amino acid permease)
VGNKVVFGRWEAASILINAVIVQVILNFPRSMVEIGGTAGWMIAVYICVLALLGFFLIQKLYSKFEGKDLLDLGEHIGGDFGRVVVGLILMAHFMFAISVILREFSEDMKVIALTVSPISLVTIFFLSGMILGAYLGIEAIARFTAIHLPIIFVFYLVFVIGVAYYCDYKNLFPILGTGLPNIFGKGFLRVSSFSALVILFMSFPFIKTKKNFKAAGYMGIGISSVFLISSSLIYIAVFRYGYGLENFLPVFQLSRLINYGRFFQRIESIFVLAWTLVAYMYLSIGFFFIVYIFKKTFKLQYLRPLILPFAVLIFTLSLMPQNLMISIDLETMYFRSAAWLVTFGVTIILLIIARFVKKSRRKGGANV